MTHSWFPKSHLGYIHIPSSDSDVQDSATPLVSSPDTYSHESLILEDAQSTPRMGGTASSGMSSSRWDTWANIKACGGRFSVSQLGGPAILLDYLAYCVALALVCAVCTFILVALGVFVLSLREPYASHGNALVGAGAIGGALLSVGLTTIAWGYNLCEEAYERAHGICVPLEDLPLYRRRHLKDERPQLVHRYRSVVFSWCGIAAVPICGIAGPAVGVVLRNSYDSDAAGGALTTMHGALCGLAGLGVCAAIVAAVWSVVHVVGCSEIDCLDDDDD